MIARPRLSQPDYAGIYRLPALRRFLVPWPLLLCEALQGAVSIERFAITARRGDRPATGRRARAHNSGGLMLHSADLVASQLLSHDQKKDPIYLCTPQRQYE